MPHLIKSQTEPFDIRVYCQQLQDAHDFMVRCGTPALRKAAGLGISKDWGLSVKRIRVEFPSESRPDLIPEDVTSHNLAEVINQCATLERLLDGLGWCLSTDSELSDYQGVLCHPTTSSAKKGQNLIADNDLILSGPGGERARFEVSDVAGEEDGNSKEAKDLVSLGVLRSTGKRSFGFDGLTWPEKDRLFLVVSDKFAQRLLRQKRAWLKGDQPHCHYISQKLNGTTQILEVCRGAAPPKMA